MPSARTLARMLVHFLAMALVFALYQAVAKPLLIEAGVLGETVSFETAFYENLITMGVGYTAGWLLGRTVGKREEDS